MGKNITITKIIYLLYAISIFTGIALIAAIIMNYVKKSDVKGTFLESHFKWQIRTFWFSILWMSIAYITLLTGVGIIIFIATAIWVLYRAIKGYFNLIDNKIMYPNQL